FGPGHGLHVFDVPVRFGVLAHPVQPLVGCTHARMIVSNMVSGNHHYRVVVISLSGSQTAISGAKQRTTTASVMRATNGSTPQIPSLRGMSGAMFLMTKRFSPTGGWIRPISMTMVMTTPNQTRSKPAALSGGRMIGAVIRMIDTGGRKKPSTTTSTRIDASSTQREKCIDTIHCAADWLMCR